MFDNHKKRLTYLDTELRALEPEEPLSEDIEEDDPEDLAPGRNSAVDFSRMAYADEDTDESAVLLKQPKKRSRRKTRSSSQTKSKKKKHAFGGQYLLAVGEILLIIAIIRWWLQWIS